MASGTASRTRPGAALSKRVAPIKVAELTPTSRGVTVACLVGRTLVNAERVPTATTGVGLLSGTRTKVAEVVVGDETGCITMSARNEQVDQLKPGNGVVITGARVYMFNGTTMRLAVDSSGGSIDVITSASSTSHNSGSGIQGSATPSPPVSLMDEETVPEPLPPPPRLPISLNNNNDLSSVCWERLL
ncbi:replication factor A1 [Pelomyxa schiedti]|nr:replication factor A1 [Pelomyxa schiedti]